MKQSEKVSLWHFQIFSTILQYSLTICLHKTMMENVMFALSHLTLNE